MIVESILSVISSTEDPQTTAQSGYTEDEGQKRPKKRRKQKTERPKLEETFVPEDKDERLGFGSTSLDNMHGPGYTTFEQKLEAENGGNISNIFCSNVALVSAVASAVAFAAFW